MTGRTQSPLKTEPIEEIILINNQNKERTKSQTRSQNSSQSPPRRRQTSEVPAYQATNYITMENEIQDRKTKTQPPTLKNIDEERSSRWSKNELENELKSASTNNQSEQRPKVESATRFLEPNSAASNNIRFSRNSPSISIQGATPNNLNIKNSSWTSPTNSMNPMGNPMMMGNNFGMGNMNNMFPFNQQQPMMPNFPLPNFENNSNGAEYQKYILMIINYYESHLNNMKNIITQQNEALNHERHINQVLEQRNGELVYRIQELDKLVKEQSNVYDTNQKELKTRYEVVLEELAGLKKSLASKQIEEGHSAAKVIFDKGHDSQNLLYHEILSLRKDLENQRQTMYDFRSSTHHLESQIRDLERNYYDELKTNSHFSQKHQQLNDALDKYKTDFIKMDTLNKIILEGYERSRKDLETIKSINVIEDHAETTETVDNFNQTQPSTNPGHRSRVPSIGFNPDLEDRKAKRELFIRSISPVRNENEGNREEMLRNKMRAQDSQIKELLQWNNKSPTTTPGNNVSVVYTQSYPTAVGPIHLNAPHQQFIQPNTSTSSAQFGHKKGNSMQGNLQSPVPKRIPQTEVKQGRPNVTFPSYQKIEDNKDEIHRIDQTLVQLNQTRKIVENELFKMPSVAKSLDQKRKKAGLEMELEGIDYQIEECKNKLRKFDVLTVKN